MGFFIIPPVEPDGEREAADGDMGNVDDDETEVFFHGVFWLGVRGKIRHAQRR